MARRDFLRSRPSSGPFKFDRKRCFSRGACATIINQCPFFQGPPRLKVGPDRVKAYYMWEQGIYWYLHAIRTLRTGEPWLGKYDYVLRMEFEVEDEEERGEFSRSGGCGRRGDRC